MKIIKKILIILIVLLIFFLVIPYMIPENTSLYKSPVDVLAIKQQSYSGKIVPIEGKNIYVEDFNEKSDNVITFIHGFGGSSFSWRYNKQFFVDNGYRVVSIDLLGFGFSQGNFNNDYSHPAQAKLIKGILDSLQIKNTYLVGHSMGGNVVTHFTQKYPDMVNKLILVDAAIVESSNNNILLNIINFDPIRRWGNIFLSSFYTKETFSNTLKSAFYDKDEVTDNTIDGYYLPLEIDDWQDSLLGISRDSNNNVLSEPLSKLDKPTLIIWGSNDSWVPIDNGKALQNKIMNSMFVEISNSGHLPMEDNPKEFNNTVLEFVRQD